METKHFELIVEKHSANPKNTLKNAGLLREAAKNALVAAIDQVAPDNDDEAREALNRELSNTLFYLQRVALDNGTTINELMREEFNRLATQSGLLKTNFTK